jgi:hypothetical protein
MQFQGFNGSMQVMVEIAAKRRTGMIQRRWGLLNIIPLLSLMCYIEVNQVIAIKSTSLNTRINKAAIPPFLYYSQ